MKFKEMHTRKNYFFINNKHIDALAMVKTYRYEKKQNLY